MKIGVFSMEKLHPKWTVFCHGDNRPNSQDSRFGVCTKKLFAQAGFFRYWPLSRLGVPK